MVTRYLFELLGCTITQLYFVIFNKCIKEFFALKWYAIILNNNRYYLYID